MNRNTQTILDAWKKIWNLIRPYISIVILSIILSLVASGLKGIIAWLVKPAMDRVFIEGQRQYLLALPIGMFLVFVLRGVADCTQAYLMANAGLRLVRDLRNKLFINMVRMPVSRSAQWRSGDIISRQLMDVALFGHVLSDSFSVFLVEVPTVIVLMGVAFYRGRSIALLALTLLPLVALGTRSFGRLVKKRRIEVQKFMGRLTHRMNEAHNGLKVIKNFGMTDDKIGQFMTENQRVYHQDSRVVLFKQGTRLFIDLISGSAVAIILGWGGVLIARGAMTTGDLFSIIVSLGMLFTPLKRLGSAYNILQESVGVLERIEEYLNVQPELIQGKEAWPLHKALRLEGVTFSYPNSPEPILKDVNLEIPAGKMVAIVGPSGAGKSTLVDLFVRFITPDRGKILWDDTDIQSFNIESLRAQIGLVTQEVILFSDSILENIAAGRPSASFEEVVEAAKMADAHDFISALPDGYYTVLDERGLNLSGGQRQRIALARAILKDPSLLILDEATSALDTVSEQAIQRALQEIKKGRTTVVIAHRLSTIVNADLIVIMDRGKIVALGDHEGLLVSSPLYRELFNAWQKNDTSG